MESVAENSSERLKRVLLQDKLKNPAKLSNELKEEITFVISRYMELKSKVIFKVGLDTNGDIDLNIYVKVSQMKQLTK